MFGRKKREVKPYELSDGRTVDISPNTQDNADQLTRLWSGSRDLVMKTEMVSHQKLLLVTLDTLIDDAQMRDVTTTLQQIEWRHQSPSVMVSHFDPMHSAIVQNMYEVNRALCGGSFVVFIEGHRHAITISIAQGVSRAIGRPELEPAILGPQVSFIEDWKTNVNLIRKRIKSNRLKVEYYDVGELSHTRVVLMYIDGIVKDTLVEELKKRMQRIETDSLSDANNLVELISDAPRSVFPTVLSTERSDRAAAGLLDGKFCLITDGSPIAIVAPIGLLDLLESAEDHYESYIVAFPLRLLRHLSFWASIMAPATYIALLSFQQELLPTRLLLSLQQSHEGIPFPTIIEAFVMVLIFETLQEAGIRLPRAVGQSVSILGTLIIGDAAVSAGIVSPGMVIVVAMTGIWTFSIPTFTLTFTARLLRYPAMVCAGLFGLTGLTIYLLMLVTHIFSLRSFGTPFFSIASIQPSKWMTSMFRGPTYGRRTRPTAFEPEVESRSRSPRPRPRRKETSP